MPIKTSSNQSNKSLPRALVIGAAGFIGSYVCESLVAQNINVVGVDYPNDPQSQNLEKLSKNKNFTYFEMDINKGIKLEDPSFEYIFHIGGIESYLSGVDVSIDNLLINSIGMHNTLELAKASNSKVLLVSLLDIYSGMMSSLDLKNYFGSNQSDTNKFSHFEAKRYAEALLAEYYRKFNVNARVVRISDVYGPRMNLKSESDCARLIESAISSDSLTIHGDGLKTLHPTFISDVVVGITKAMFVEETIGKIYNLVSKEEINVLNLAYAIQKNSTKPLKIQFAQDYTQVNFPLHKTEFMQTEKDLAWKAKTTISEGITLTLEYLFLNKAKDSKISDQAKKPEPPKIEKQSVITPVSNPNHEVIPIHEELINTNTKTTPQAVLLPTVETVKVKHKISYLNAVLVSSSFFIILILFVFPITTLFLTTSWAITETESALLTISNQKQLKDTTIKSQQMSTMANIQFDTLEWFFNLTQQRESYENTRTKLQAIEKLNSTLNSIPSNKRKAELAFSNILQGESNSLEIRETNQDYENTMLDIQKTILDTQSIDNSLLSTESRTKISNINSSASIILSDIQSEYATNQFIFNLLAPTQPTNNLITLMDNTKASPFGGKPIGYMYNNLTRSGITKFEFVSFLDDQKIINTLDSQKLTELDTSKSVTTHYYANNSLMYDLVKAYGPVTLKKYADVVTSENIKEKIQNNNSEYQISIWREIFKNVRDTKSKTKILGQILVHNIKAENIKELQVVQSSTDIFPKCDYNDSFKQLLSSGLIQTNPIYCISLKEDQVSTQPQLQIIKKINLDQKMESNLPSKFKLTLNLDNKSNQELNENISISIPKETKLTNVQVVFPISFDKVRTTEVGQYITHTFNVIVPKSSSKDVIVEWQDLTKIDSNQVISIQKPVGSIIESIAIKKSK
ncbi:MAG: NAD-dependent epimerase/dehydratase family protein [bacterium]|nr:NAD-dependent epimerase/dehydratase family protein [bacterium]